MSISDVLTKLKEGNLFLLNNLEEENLSLFLVENVEVDFTDHFHELKPEDLPDDFHAQVKESKNPAALVAKHVFARSSGARDQFKNFVLNYLQGDKDEETGKWSGRGAGKIVGKLRTDYAVEKEKLEGIAVPEIRIHFGTDSLPKGHPLRGKTLTHSVAVSPEDIAHTSETLAGKSSRHLNAVSNILKLIANADTPKKTRSEEGLLNSKAFSMADESLHGGRFYSQKNAVGGETADKEMEQAAHVPVISKSGGTTDTTGIHDIHGDEIARRQSSQLFQGVGAGRTSGSLSSYRSAMFLKNSPESVERVNRATEAATIRDHVLKTFGMHNFAAQLHNNPQLREQYNTHLDKLAKKASLDPYLWKRVSSHVESTFGEAPKDPGHAISIIKRYMDSFNPKKHLSSEDIGALHHAVLRQGESVEPFVGSSTIHFPHPKGFIHPSEKIDSAFAEFDRPPEIASDMAKQFKDLVFGDSKKERLDPKQELARRKESLKVWRSIPTEIKREGDVKFRGKRYREGAVPYEEKG